jgi:hypothetical protein
MAYNFKSIADVEVVAEPAESANVLIEENGVIKKAPKTAVGGNNGADAVVIQYDIETEKVFVTPDAYNILFDAFTNSIGIPIFAYEKRENYFRSGPVEFVMIVPADGDGTLSHVRVIAYARVYDIFEDGSIWTAPAD